jgi:ribosome-binding factor A
MAVISRRQERVSSLLKNLISSFIKSENLLGSVVTISAVEVAKDIKTAKVFISVFPEEKEKETIKLLEEKSHELYNYFSSRLKMRFTPRVIFLPDKIMKAERRIGELLKKAAS